MKNWVSVKDALPVLDKVVLVCFPSDFNGEPTYAFGARLDDEDGWVWGIANGYSATIHPSDDAIQVGIECDDDYKVSHWQLLDEPPFNKPQPDGDGTVAESHREP